MSTLFCAEAVRNAGIEQYQTSKTEEAAARELAGSLIVLARERVPMQEHDEVFSIVCWWAGDSYLAV
jgi:hypothetical protein